MPVYRRPKDESMTPKVTNLVYLPDGTLDEVETVIEGQTRLATLNYDGNQNLTSITTARDGQVRTDTLITDINGTLTSIVTTVV